MKRSITINYLKSFKNVVIYDWGEITDRLIWDLKLSYNIIIS